jgi:long-subunit fatty acid transport protein
MKKLMLSAALVVAASTAFAADFDNNSVDLVLERDNLTFGVSSTAGEATDLSVGVAVLPHAVLGADADLTLGAEYGIQSEDLTLSAAYGLSKHYGQVNVYGSFEAAYTIESGADEGTWDATPTVGVAYRVNDQLTTFADVDYTWDATNDWTTDGGSVELGVRYAINDDVALTPSLVRTFDTESDETNLNLEVALRF